MHRRHARDLLIAFAFLAASLPAPAGSALAATSRTLGQGAPAPGCVPETEPNDHEGDAGTVTGPVCINGGLPDGDQDLFVWDVSGQPTGLWNFSVTGVPGTTTALKILTITSEPGVTPVVAGAQIGEIDTNPSARSASAADILITPGRYLLGVTRTASPGGTLDDVSYSFQIAPGSAMPANGDREPNDDQAHARRVTGDLSLSGDSGRSDDFYAWTPPAGTARWQLQLQGPLGSQPVMRLYDQAGHSIAQGTGDASGSAWLHDLVLGSKPVIVDVAGTSDPEAYVLRASPETFQGGDPEPNNDATTAVALDPSALAATGRLANPGDIDDFSFHVDDHLSGLLLDIKLIWRHGPQRQICLFDPTGTQLTCRAQAGADLLGNLLLPVGDYTIEIRGDPDANDRYLLRIDATSPPSDQFETEPNDQAINASPWTAGVTMHGTGSNFDADTFRVTVSGAPQLYELDATGPEIQNVLWEDRDGTVLATAQVAPDNGSATLTDMYLVPGDHWIDVRANGDYSLTLTPLGPPDPNAELEPNNDSLHAQALPLDTPRTGRISSASDLDIDRISLQAAEHLKLHMQPPSDGSLAWSVRSGSTVIAQGPAGALGAVDDEDLSLPPGDYELWLEGGQPSKSAYTVELDREDPFPPAAALPASVSLTLSTTGVAAYWSAGQHLDGTLTVGNTGSSSEDIALDAVTSDGRWTVSFGKDHVTVGAGATESVPLTVNVPSDAWAGVPVRVSVRAVDGTGAAATGFVNVTPTADAPPVSPYQAWSVPDALLGGLDVAATALGGSPVLQYDPTMETQLYDGYTPAGGGLDTTVTLPATFTSDLAGDSELPIAGMIVNPQARNADINDAPKDVELLLSNDGTTWTTAIKGTMTPLGVDQAFVLPATTDAKFARLQVDSTYGDGARVAVGEFKVIAVPGTAPAPAAGTVAQPLDIADPALGGHVVTIEPQTDSPQTAATLLDAGLNSAGVLARAGTHVTWTIGFWNDRAAQISGLGWLDPNGSDPTRRFTQIHVETSLDSPFGPWTDQGAWKLKRAPDGSVSAYPFAQGVWARYFRFTTDAAKQDVFRELPGALQAFEVPTDANNRSVLGEYGPTQSGPYELVNPPALAAPDYAADANDSADTASPLTDGQAATSTVHNGQDVDWYDVVPAAGQNTITFTVKGTPRVGVSLTLVDDAGSSVAMTFGHGTDPGSATYTAAVTPGKHYRVEVQQPPFSVVFTFDTSGSMGNYLPFVYEAIHSFSNAVVPGRQAVKIVPFEQTPVLTNWTDDKYALQDALEGVIVDGGGSSAAETSLLNATEALSSQEGATAIVMVTDADTTSFDHTDALWEALAKVRPLVFDVHVAADGVIAPATALMQDWAYSSGGFYQYTRSHGEMDRAFDRMATWLERPTEYTISYATSFVEPPKPSTNPGTLQVLGPPGLNGTHGTVPAGSGVAVEVILDTSGSMLTPISAGTRRIDAAKKVLDDLLRSGLPKGAPVALRVLGNAADVCGTDLVVPLGPLDPAGMTRLVDGIDVVQQTDTPIAAAINAVPTDLNSVQGTKTLVLITDSQEVWPNRDLCGKDPAVAIKALVKKGIDASVNIVGLAVSSRAARQNLTRWAHDGNGVFYSASSAEELSTALANALQAPFRVYDADSKLVASGVVGGPAVPLKPGTYHVVVLSEPQTEFDATVEAGKPFVFSVP